MSTSMPLTAGVFSARSPTSTDQDPCGKTTSQRNDGPGFPCYVCGKVIGREPDLRRHMEGHDPFAEKIKCDFCPYECLKSQRSNMRAHMRIHTGEQPFVCGFRDCDFRCSDQSSLCRHRNKHSHHSPASLRRARAKGNKAVQKIASPGSKKLKRTDKAKAKTTKKGKAISRTPSTGASRQTSLALSSTRTPSPVLSIDEVLSPSSSSSVSSFPVTPSSPFPSARLPAQDYSSKHQIPLPSMELMEALYEASGYPIPSVEDIRSIFTPLRVPAQPTPSVGVSVESNAGIGFSPASAIWIEDDEDDLDSTPNGYASGPVAEFSTLAANDSTTVPPESMLLQMEPLPSFDYPLPSPPSEFSPVVQQDFGWQNATPTYALHDQVQGGFDWTPMLANGPQVQVQQVPSSLENSANNMFALPPQQYIPQQYVSQPGVVSQNDFFASAVSTQDEMPIESFLMELDQRYLVQAFTL